MPKTVFSLAVREKTMVGTVSSALVGVESARSISSQNNVSTPVAAPPPSPPPEAVDQAGVSAPVAPFISLVISVDLDFDRAVLQVRDSETGDVEDQFPTESRLAAIRAEQASLQTPAASQNATSATSVQSQQQGLDVVTVQDVTTAQQPSNISLPSPQAAVAALTTGAQSAQVSQPSSDSVSVLA